MSFTTNIILCGTGGQGILLASEVVCAAAWNSGFDVKKSEVHGMAQRGEAFQAMSGSAKRFTACLSNREPPT